MKIVIAPDSFKESLSSEDAAEAIRRGFARVLPQAEYVCVPVADGGEGTTAALVAACGGEWVNVEVEDPLGRPVTARYGLLPDGTAVLEMAEASGLQRLAPDERNPEISSTYGCGEMMLDALRRGVKRIVLGIGGSATNDGGAGMLQALGYRLLDAAGQDLPRGGAALARFARMDDTARLPALDDCEIVVACDVDNPLCGARGASAVFAPQKGASPAMVARLDAALQHYAGVLIAQGYADERITPGSGAAGGLGFALQSVLGATLQPGIALVLAAAQLDEHLADADLVITGEGRMDGQTASGKVPLGVLRLARARGIPVIALNGSVSTELAALYDLGFAAIFSSVAEAAPLASVLAAAADNLERTAQAVAALWALKQGARMGDGE